VGAKINKFINETIKKSIAVQIISGCFGALPKSPSAKREGVINS
jgi:hypothetical protein